MRFALILFIIGFFAAGCQPKEEGAEPAEQYAAKGRVVEINPEPGMVLIKHSEIPDFMPAMVMMFHLENPELLTGVQNNDSIHFTLSKTEAGFVITEIDVIR